MPSAVVCSTGVRDAVPSGPLRTVIISRVKRNPYVTLLCEGLCRANPGLEPRIVDHFSVGWMWRQRNAVDLIHIHWLELLFTYPTLKASLKRWLSVMLGLLVARLYGVHIVYTLHNLGQHEGRRSRLTRAANRVMFALAHCIHVHDAGTADILAKKWARRRGVYVIPHGSYVSAYPNVMGRQESRDRLGIGPDHSVYLFLGRLRPYKGLEELITSFRSVEASEAVLIVAGEAQEPAYASSIRALAQGDPRIRLHLEFVAEDRLQLFFNACDISVLPYRHVTTSGAAILSFSFGVPILAPRLGCFVELVGADERGRLYDPEEVGGILGGLAEIKPADLAAMRAACTKYAADLSWENIARMHATMYLDSYAHGDDAASAQAAQER